MHFFFRLSKSITCSHFQNCISHLFSSIKTIITWLFFTFTLRLITGTNQCFRMKTSIVKHCVSPKRFNIFVSITPRAKAGLSTLDFFYDFICLYSCYFIKLPAKKIRLSRDIQYRTFVLFLKEIFVSGGNFMRERAIFRIPRYLL